MSSGWLAMFFSALFMALGNGSLERLGTMQKNRVRQGVVAASNLAVILSARPSLAAEGIEAGSSDTQLFIDKINRFSASFPPGWTKFVGKQPTPTMLKYQVEESLLVGNNFAEGASFGVTRTNAVRLLKDFGVEWWFAPLESMTDVGSPELVAELLVLQRQGDFERKTSPSQLRNSNFVGNTLLFEFDTPLAESVNRRTICKTIFRPALPNSKSQTPTLYCFWISALSNVMIGDYRPTIDAMRDSFTIL
jgi:hypothetical protein